jgi:hypothetical protein
MSIHEMELEGAAPVWRAAYPLGESEGETEAFFEDLAEYAAGGGRGPAAAAAAAAARAATAGLWGSPPSGVPLATFGGGPERGIIDGEAEWEVSHEGFTAEMLMEHFGHAATEAETEAEAEAFLFPLLPLAAKALMPLGKMALRRVAPQVMRGAVRVMRNLRRNPQTRPLVRMMPTIIRRTAYDVGRAAQQGRPVTPQTAVRYLSNETRRVLADPRHTVNVYQRSRALDRRFHVTVREIGPR